MSVYQKLDVVSGNILLLVTIINWSLHIYNAYSIYIQYDQIKSNSYIMELSNIDNINGMI